MSVETRDQQIQAYHDRLAAEYRAMPVKLIERDHKGENCACRCAKKGVEKKYWCYCDDPSCCGPLPD